MKPLIEAEGLTKTYQHGRSTIIACDNVDLVLRAGTLAVIQGPSGSGKTTLLNLLTGWEMPDTGRVLWDGKEIRPDELTWGQMAIVPQRLGLYDELTIQENVTLPARPHLDPSGKPDVIRHLDLDDVASLRPDQASRGQQQRAALARALIVNPRLIVADEPTSAQDEQHAHQLLLLMRQYTDAGGTALVASHDPIIHEHASAVIAMRDGTLFRPVSENTNTLQPASE